MARKSKATLYLIEHSLTAGDADGKDVMNGWSDRPITDEGKKLVGPLADFLKSKNVGEVYSSDLARAVQTATLLKDKLGVEKPLVERRGLRPMDVGTMVGQPKEEVQHILDDLKSRKWAKAPGGESLASFLGRWHKELDRTIHEALAENHACAYVTHSHNLGTLAHLLTGGVAPVTLDSPVGACGVIALHVTRDGHATADKAYTGSEHGK
jgi:broad specificity phosphatase PhoE